jgi:diguanylate cyclase (GGDEF)-like protein
MPFYNWPTYVNLSIGTITGLVSVAVFIFAWRRRNNSGAKNILWLASAAGSWAIFYFLEIFSNGLSNKVFWENLQYLSISLVPVIYFTFVSLYSNWKKPLNKLFWAGLFIQPVLNQIILWTDPLHHWFRVNSTLNTMGLSFPGIHINQYGWWFWCFSVYTLLFLLVDVVLMLITFLKAPYWARGKHIVVVIGMIIPFITAILTIPQLVEQSKDYGLLIAVTASLVVMAMALLRLQIRDVIPIARKALLDQLIDSVFVLDADGRIIQLNQSAQTYFENISKNCFGQHITTVLPQLFQLKFGAENKAPEEIQIIIEKNKQVEPFEVRMTGLLNDDKSLAGWLVVFRNIAHRKAEEEQLRQAELQTELALKDAQHHTEELLLLRKVNELLNQATSLRQALIPTMQSLMEVAHGLQIWILLLENDNHTHRSIQFLPDEPETPLIFLESLPNTPECIQDLLARKLVKPTYYSACGCDRGIVGFEKDDRTHISFPLKSGVGPLGVINITLDKPQLLDEDSMHLIETICDSLSVSIERIQLFKTEYDQRRLAETMQEIGVTLTASLDLNEVLDLLLDQIAKLVPYDSGDVIFIDNDNAWISRSRGYDFLGKKASDSLLHITFPIKSTTIIRSVLVEKRPSIVPDTHTDPDWISTPGTPFFHCWIGAPVIINDKVSAIFSLNKKEIGFYNQAHANRLVSLCSDAALAIQNAQLYEAGKKRIRELESLQTTLKDISSELNIKKLLYDIIERAVNLMDATGGILSLFDKNTGNTKVIVGINSGTELVGTETHLNKETLEGLTVLKEPYVVQEYAAKEKRSDEVAKVFPHALLTIPLVVNKELLGTIGIGDSRPTRVFNDDDTRLMSLFAQQATVAITNARLFEGAKRRADEAETMRQASAIVASSLEQKQALRLILEQLALVIPCDSASILLPKGDDLEIVDGRGFKEHVSVMGLRIPMGDNQPGSIVFREKKSIIVSDMEAEFPAFNNVIGLPIKSWIGVPLIYQKKAIGILAIDSLSKNSYTNDHARLAQAFADQVSIALENVRLYEEAVKSAKRLAGLYKMSQRINANLRPEEVYRAIHKATIELMAPDAFILSMYDEGAKTINDVYFVDHGIPQKVSSRPLGQGLSSRVLKEKKTIMYNNFNLNMLTKTKAVLVGDEKDPTMVRSLIIVPLKLGKKITGIISAQSYRADAFTEEDKETLELLAAHAVIALENAQLFSEVQELAITDSLTRIYNRRQFFDLAEQEFDRSRRYTRPFSIIMFDIDFFKKVNDSYGHSVGDVVLQKIADICKHALRDVDIFARYGGEEFVILLPETTATEAELMAERLRQLIARTPMEISGIKINVTLSFGVVEIDETCRDIEDLLDRSDQALYHSKRTGRNRVSVWTPDMHLWAEVSADQNSTHN